VDTSGNESITAAVIVTDFGVPVIDTLLTVYDELERGWPGLITTGAFVADDVVAAGTTFIEAATAAAAMWSLEAGDLMWATSMFDDMTYLTTVSFTGLANGARVFLEHEIEGDPYRIEFRPSSTASMWAADSGDLMWGTAGDYMWDQSTGSWATWPGEIAVGASTFDFRVTTGLSSVQGVIAAMRWLVFGQRIEEIVGDVTIPADGMRLALAKDYTQISAVLITLQYDGGTAMVCRVLDKDPDVGPLVRCYDAAGNPAAAYIDAHILGV
jgi:hypothetical protein